MPKAPKSGGGGGLAGAGLKSTLQAASGKFTPRKVRTPKKGTPAPQHPPAPGRLPKAPLDAKGRPATLHQTPPAQRRPADASGYQEKQNALWEARNATKGRGKRGMDDATRARADRPWAGDAAKAARRRAENIYYPRQTFTQKHRDAVWDDHFGKDETSGTDVGGRTVFRDDEFDARKADGRLPAKEQRWQMGHVGGHEHWKNVQGAIDDWKDPQAFKDDYLDTGNYRPEHQRTNGSHQHEED